MSAQPDAQRPPATRHPRDLYYELGMALLERQRHAEAVTALQNALKEDGESPTAVEVRAALSEAHTQAGEKGLAFVNYLEALAVTTELREEQLDRAHELLPRLLDKDNLKWAQEEWGAKIQPAAQTDATRFGLNTLLGRLKLYSQDYSGAAELFKQAVASNREDPRGWEGLGESLWKQGHLDEAAEAFSYSYSLAQKGSGAGAERRRHINSKLTRVLAEMGHYEAAFARVAQFEAGDDPEAYLTLVTRSHCLLALGMPSKALEDAEQAARLQPKGAQAYLMSAQALTSLKKYKDAINAADQALQYDPTNSAVILSKAQALIEGQIDLEQARRLLARLRQRAGGDGQAVLKFLSPAVGRAEPDGNTHYFLAQLKHILGQPEEAFREVTRALDLGLSGDVVEPSAPAVQLKAELMLARGDEEAAAEMLEAGRLFAQRADYATAVKLFEAAAQARPEEQKTYWLLSDALRMGAVTKEYPFKDQAAFEQSLMVWRKGISLGTPPQEFAWVYLVPALTLESLSTFTEHPKALYVESLLHAERSLLLDARNELAWTYLGRFARLLFMESNSKVALDEARALSPTDTQAIVERFILGVLLAEESALQLPEEFPDAFSASPEWKDLIVAYFHSFKGRNEEAARSLAGITEEFLNDPDMRSLRGGVLRRLDRWEEAKADYEWIWEKTAPGGPIALPGNLFTRAWTGCVLGHYAEAEEIIRGLPPDGEQDYYDFHLNLFFCLIGQGRLTEARAEFELALPLLRTERQLEETRHDLSFFEGRLAHHPEQAAIGELVEACRREVERVGPSVREKTYNLPAAEIELEQALRKAAGDDQKTARGALLLGLARVRLGLGKFEEAASTYRAFGEEFTSAPEVTQGLGAAFDGVLAGGERLLKEGKPGEAVGPLEGALRLSPDKSGEAGVRARLGLVRLRLADPEAARAEFDHALASYREAGGRAPGEALGAVCRQLLSGVEEYWQLDDAWQAAAAQAGAGEERRSDYAAARKTLTHYLDETYKLSERAPGSSPLAEPIKVYLGEELVPEAAGDETKLVQVQTPEMRARIEGDRGVKVPAVRFLDSDDIPSDRYSFLLDELPAESGAARPGMRFSPAPAESLRAVGVDPDSLIEAASPVDAQPGAWVAPAHWETVERAGVELWPSTLSFMLRQLETVLRRRLKEFVGVQEVENLLRELRRNEEHAFLVRETLPDRASGLAFARVLRELVRENVPINELAAILRAARAAGLGHEPFPEVLSRVRFQLKEALSGNQPGATRIQIPQSVEAALAGYLRKEDGGTKLAVPISEGFKIISGLTEYLTEQWGGEEPPWEKIVLVIENAALRFYFSHVISALGLDMAVMAQEEFLPEDAPPETGAPGEA